MAEPTISGALLSQHREILREVVGDATLKAALAALPPADRDLLESATSMSYIPIRTADALYAEIGKQLGRDPAAVHEQVSRMAVERALKTVWRLLLRFTTDEALVSRTPLIFSRAFPQGTLVPRLVAPGHAEIRVEAWPDIPEYAIRGTRVAIETVLRLAGRAHVKITSEKTIDGARYRATWAS